MTSWSKDGQGYFCGGERIYVTLAVVVLLAVLGINVEGSFELIQLERWSGWTSLATNAVLVVAGFAFVLWVWFDR